MLSPDSEKGTLPLAYQAVIEGHIGVRQLLCYMYYIYLVLYFIVRDKNAYKYIYVSFEIWCFTVSKWYHLKFILSGLYYGHI